MDAFSAIIGQSQAIALLRAAIARDHIAPGYLFVGPSGTGRSLAAQAFTQMLVADRRSSDFVSNAFSRVKARNHPDVLWVEPTYLDKGKLLTTAEAEAAGLKRRAAPQIRLEQVREVADFLSRPPLESKRSVVIITEAQTMAEPAANALLKTLEEPGQATIIAIAPDPGSVLPTLVSRCQRIPFYRLSQSALQQVLHQIGRDNLPDSVITLAQGSPGAAISAMAQFQSISPDLLAAVQQPPQRSLQALELARQIDRELDVESQIWLIDYLQNYYWQSSLLSKTDNSALLLNMMQSLEAARQQLNSYVQPRLVWEITFLQYASNLREFAE
ncbi:DNA polymerase III subunit delta' [Pseudanabaena sp. PCC 6802]|uniref:DNA polymerase III subunit delta' n=1 Tax=Pseudanabaena sp. PCC 6802 TaxID=118173 RepID=UPI000348FF08|nr:DNA polymerase III subunit delta' [Pseudanabaena sp. PCC 6802]